MTAERSKSDKTWVKEMEQELQDNYIGYFNNTTVHGLKYLTEPRRPWPEKVLWFLGVLIGLVACIWLMYKTTVRWMESPVIVAMDESHRTVWQIPFPAVTVCPQAKAKTEFFNYTDYVIRYRNNNLTSKERDYLAKAQIPCKIPGLVENKKTLNDRNGTEVIEKISLGILDVIETTNMNPFSDPEFKPILTKEGMCFSFNMMPSKIMFRKGTFHANSRYLQYTSQRVQWDPTKGYEKDTDLLQAYPRPALGVGDETGLSMALKTKFKHLHAMCNSLGHGFQVILHSPIEFPQLRHETVFVPLGSFSEIFLTPHEIRTPEDLRYSYTPQQRQCFFHDERYLAFFHFYTQKNCELECLANRTLSDCGCVEFHMPRLPETPVCGRDEMCAKRVAGYLYLNRTLQGKYCKTCKDAQTIHHPPCECLQSCAHIRYNSHYIQSTLDAATAAQLLHRNDVTNEPTNRSHVSIYYKDSLFIPVRRVEVFGTADLLGSLGGLMGLCMGISLLSVIELFYWMFIRPFCQRIKQSNPQLRSFKKNHRTQNVEAAVQYSRYLENEVAKQDQNL